MAALSTIGGGPGNEFRSVHQITSFAIVRSVRLTRDHYPRSLCCPGPRSTIRLDGWANAWRLIVTSRPLGSGRDRVCFRAQDWVSLCGEEATSVRGDTE